MWCLRLWSSGWLHDAIGYYTASCRNGEPVIPEKLRASSAPLLSQRSNNSVKFSIYLASCGSEIFDVGYYAFVSMASLTLIQFFVQRCPRTILAASAFSLLSMDGSLILDTRWVIWYIEMYINVLPQYIWTQSIGCLHLYTRHLVSCDSMLHGTTIGFSHWIRWLGQVIIGRLWLCAIDSVFAWVWRRLEPRDDKSSTTYIIRIHHMVHNKLKKHGNTYTCCVSGDPLLQTFFIESLFGWPQAARTFIAAFIAERDASPRLFGL